MDDFSNQDDESFLFLRFIGDEFENKSVPIYELGQTLISIQRIVNKAYLLKEHRIELNSQLTDTELLGLSLQIKSRYKQSDGYGLVPFLADPSMLEIIKTVLVEGIKALSTYALAKVEIRKEQKKTAKKNKWELAKSPPTAPYDDASQIFISAIYNDVRVITERIDERGNIQNIEIALPYSTSIPPVNFNRETKTYVKRLENQPILGKLQDIDGTIERLDTFRSMAEIRLINTNYRIKVHLETKDFDLVRYKAGKDEIVTFSGRPIMKLGARTRFKEFEAYSVTLHRK